jgi:indole-3-glycerol phosphate synthase
VATYLDEIIAAHRAAAKQQRHSVHDLQGFALEEGPVRPFREALTASAGISVIAEVKRRSPSKGDLAPDLDPSEMARAYEAAGAACISVLTDKQFFGGSRGDLQTVRQAVSRPILRKDFTVCEEDVCETRWFGADAVLLIAAALNDDELRRFHELARWLAIDALVEVHDEVELDRAMAVGADLVGVNQRDLRTFEVDTARAVRVGAAIPDTVVTVAESGIRTADDVSRLRDAGYDAVLVGEALVTAADPGAKLRELVGCS